MRIFNAVFYACVFVFPIYLISSAITRSKKRRERVKQRAIEQGHVVTAKLIKTSHTIRNVPGTHMLYSRKGTYEYTYNGKKYKFSGWFQDPKPELILYFDKKPSKATVENDLNDSNINWFWIYATTALFFYWVNLA